jgi:hypothetical protein
VLVVDETETDDPSIIGEEAHIVAQKDDGPRGLSDLSIEQRDRFENLILLCRNHHKVIDDQEKEYTVDLLKAYKATHLKYVLDNLIVDKVKQKDDERYATYLEKFIELTDLHNWNNWTSWFLGSTETIPKYIFELLREVPDFIVSRIWPHRYEKLEATLINFKSVLNDFFKVYFEYAGDRKNSDSNYSVERFYKHYYRDACEFSGRKYSRADEMAAVDKYHYHVALLEDLFLELTRAANYICDAIRESLFEGFRIEEGALLITRGDLLGSNTYRVEYRGIERELFPYKGLRDFMKVREERDLSIGSGVNEDYFPKYPWQS